MRNIVLEERISTVNSYMKRKFGQRVVRISFDTGLSCPWGKCIFCQNSSYSPQASVNMKNDSWLEDMKKSRNFLAKRYKASLFAVYFQSGTSTFGPDEMLMDYYRKSVTYDNIVAFILSTRPDYIDKEKIEMILKSVPERIDEVWIELGLQSIKDNSLKLLNRGHDAESYFKALDIIKEYADSKIKVAPHIILGIPGESAEDMHRTVLESIDHPVVKGLKLHHLQVHRGTELEKIYSEQNFELFTLDKYVETLSNIIAVIPEDVVLFRLFTTTPGVYLVAPKWRSTTQEALQKLEEHMIVNKIKQGCRRRSYE